MIDVVLNDFLFSFNAVAPVFLCCVVGYVLRQLRVVGDAFVTDSTKVVFYVAIPCKILESMLQCDLKAVFAPELILFTVAAIILTAAVLVAVVPGVIRNSQKSATVTIDMFRGNFAILGIPLATSLLGDSGAAPTMTLIPFGMVMYNVLTVLILVMLTGERHGEIKKEAKEALIKAMKNPLTIASLVSLLLGVLEVDLPVVFDSTIAKLADMTTGLALMMLGSQFNLNGCRNRLGYSIVTIIVRLVLIPLAVVGVAIVLGFRSAELVAVYAFFAAPTAVNCFILSDRLGGDSDIAADAIVTTSLASVVTLTLGIFFIKTMQYI